MSIFSAISDGISSVLHGLKDKPASFGLRMWLNKQFERYGVMTKLEINSKNKTITAELDLKGEAKPITVTVEKYVLSQEDGCTFIELKKISTSREWITVLLDEFLPERKFPVLGAVRIVL